MNISPSELILGGQKSGKSARAENIARHWLAQDLTRRAVLIATAQAWDDEMTQRIQRHQQDRALRVPGLATREEPLYLAHALRECSQANTLVVIDCMTLWLTNFLMPAEPAFNAKLGMDAFDQQAKDLIAAITQAKGPVVLVSNEIGLGVIPLGAQVRQFVDRLGGLNQALAAACQRVTLMSAGLPLTLKEPYEI